MNNRSLVAASLITAGAVSMSASAALVAGWSMPTAVAAATTGTNYNYGAANLGDATSGTMLSGFHAVAATTWSSPGGNGSTYSLSSNNWSIGDYYQVSLSTTGYADPITLSFDQTRSSTGPATFEVFMSTDGGTDFNTVLAPYTVVQAGLAGTGTTSDNRFFGLCGDKSSANIDLRARSEVSGDQYHQRFRGGGVVWSRHRLLLVPDRPISRRTDRRI